MHGPVSCGERVREQVSEAPIAIVGLSGRFAGADLDAFRKAVMEGRPLLGPLPPGRFAWTVPPRGAAAQPQGGFLADIDRFDAALFGVGAREAARMSPQSRLLLEACRAAMEDAGHAPRSFAGTTTGVFVATTFDEWPHRLRRPERAERLRLPDLLPNMLANRLSRAFDLAGSSETYFAACSGGLLAVHRACAALRAGECGAALAGAASLILSGDGYVGEAKAGMLSRDGRSLAFDEAGQGFVRGEGVGMVLLKPLDQALRDRDSIRAVIRGSAAGHGGASGGYDPAATAMPAQVVARALRAAGIAPREIGYLEVQAGGRPAEDAAELAVIAEGFRQAAEPGAALPRPAAGAVKPITGHMESASGLGQIAKAVAVLETGRVPPVPGLTAPAAAVLAAWPGLRLPREAADWPDPDAPRRALVSGFGFGGSHVHLVLEVAPSPAPAAADRAGAILLSAASPALLAEAARRLAARLAAPDPPSLADLAFTLLVGRDAMAERAAFLAEDPADLAAQLTAFAASPERAGPWLRGQAVADGTGPVLGRDAEDRDWLAGLIRAGRWRKLAALWCGGLTLDWPALADVLCGRRVPLPATPLAETRFWTEDAADAPAAAGPVAALARAGAATGAPGPAEAPPVVPATDHEAPEDDAPGQTAAEERRRLLLALLAETLGCDGTEWQDADSPIALGLDSLAAAELRERIASRCGGACPSLAALLGAPDLAALAALMPEADGPAPVALAADPEGRYAPFPVTDIQLAYLIGRQGLHQHGGFGCQVYWEFDRDRFDVPALESALNRLVLRHDMLRAVFTEEATQRVLPPEEAGPVVIPLHDLSALPAEAAAGQRGALATAMRDTGFDPARFPLFRFAVSRDAAGDRLHVTVDLLLADGPSLLLLLEELAALHDDPGLVLPPIGFGFRDYVLAARGRATAAAADRAYWQARLDTLPPPPALPLLPGHPPVTAFLRHAALMPAALWRRFQERAAAHGLTANAVLITAFAESLAAWAERPDFCLNVTLAQRHPLHPDVPRLVGDFTGNLLLAVPDRGTRDVAGQAAAIAAQLAADMEHAGCSAVQVLGMLAQRRRAPVAMPVVFTSLLGYGGLLKRPARIDAVGRFAGGLTRTPQVWLDAQVLDSAEGLHVSWDALAGLLMPDLLADMFAGFVARLHRLAEEPSAWTAPPPRAAPAALRAANATAARLPLEPIFAGLLRAAAAAPEAPAVIADDRRLTFATLTAEARTVAARLRQAGLRPGDPVGVVMAKGWRQVVAVLAIGLAGGAYVPLELPLPPARIAALLARAGTAMALTHAVPDAVDWPCPTAALDEWLAQPALPWEPVTVAATDLAYILFTSGSTGEPKGVAMQHGAVANTLHDVNARFGVTAADRVLGLSSLGFDLSVWDLFGVLGAGGAVVLPPPESLRDPACLAALAARERVSLWNSTPAYLKLVLEAPGVALPPSLRCVLLSGDWIPLPLARRLRDVAPEIRLISLGGATEAAIWSICHPVEAIAPEWRSIPYGRPMANQRFHVLDDDLRPCPVDEPGQLHIGGTGLAAGYWRDPDRTAASFIRHPETGERLYRTGDYGRVLADGSIEFLGRRDAQVKIGGHRIELGEVEAALQAVPGLREALAFPVVDAGGNPRLAAAYCQDPGDDPRQDPGLSPAALRQALAATLPAYMVPAVLLPLERMPLTPNGKVDRNALTALAARRGNLPGPETVRDPAPAPEPGVADVLGTLLGRADVLQDEAGRAAFQAAAPWRRRDFDALPAVALQARDVLPGPDSPAIAGGVAPARASVRAFAGAPVPRPSLDALLAPMRDIPSNRSGRRRYGSAGSTYAVQLSLIAADQGCDGLPAGLWHYDPEGHRLRHLSATVPRPDLLHVPANRDMAQAAAFCLILVGRQAAIRPLYGALAPDLMRIEAGAMAQLLAETAAGLGLGLCGIGWMDLAPLRADLRLDDDDLFLHALVGGRPAEALPAEAPRSVPALPLPEVPPAHDRMARVRAAWAAVLEHDDFHDDASFFEVGGNSFLAVALQARLAAECQPAPTVTDLFRYPTIRALAATISGEVLDGPAAPGPDQAATPSPALPAPPLSPGPHPATSRRARRLAARGDAMPAGASRATNRTTR